MKNAFNSLAINLGSVFLPAISGVGAVISYFVNGITYVTGLVPGLNGVLGGLIATFLLAKPVILAYAIAKNYLKDCTILLKGALIKTRIHLLAFRNSCILSNIALKAKTITTNIYTASINALSFVLGGLSKVFKAVAVGIRALNISFMISPIGLILGSIAIVAGLIIANWSKVKAWFMGFVEWLKPVWEPIYNVIKGVFDKCSGVFISFKNIIISVVSPLAEFFNSIWRGISDFFYAIFGGMFEWFGDKLSWISEAIASVGNFINDVLGFFGLNDDEVKVSTNKQSEEKIINAYRDELPQTNEILETKSIKQMPINSTPSFNNGSINVTVNGTFNIATKDGDFNMQEFATAIQKSIFDALRKQEQNKINTTIYG